MIVLKNILVATDFGGASITALRYGQTLARMFSAKLHVVHVVDELMAHPTIARLPIAEVSRRQREAENEARGMLGALVTPEVRKATEAKLTVLTSATPADPLLSYAQNELIDLIVVGTHGRGGLAHFFMGSVAQKIVREAHCPVLTVRQAERDFVAPDPNETTAHPC